MLDLAAQTDDCIADFSALDAAPFCHQYIMEMAFFYLRAGQETRHG